MSICYLDQHIFHISLYDLGFIGIIFTGLTLALQLLLVKSVNRAANRFLGLALVFIVLHFTWLVCVDVKLDIHFPRSIGLLLNVYPAIGSLLFFYVLKLTRPEYRFTRKDLLHFAPFILVQIPLAMVQYMVFLSVPVYLFKCLRLIERYYQLIKFNEGDRHRIKLRWLRNALTGFCLLWILQALFIIVGYYHDFKLGTSIYYPFYLLLGILAIRMSAIALAKSGMGTPVDETLTLRTSIPAELKQKSAWLKKAVVIHRYYEDPDLSLVSLAEKLKLTPHELSRIINTALRKSFNDFINEYRVIGVIRKMQDPAYDHITLLGIAFESGFNSKSTFNRIFKQITGESPIVYKNIVKKEFPSYNLRRSAQIEQVVLHQEITNVWSPVKNANYMFQNYLKIAWRNLTRNKVSSFINIGGLAVGMAVAMLIGLWIFDELSFNKYHQNYNRIAIVMQKKTFNGTINTDAAIPLPLDAALRRNYGPEFKHIVLTAWNSKHILNFGDKNISFTGNFMSPDAPEMLTLHMLAGTRNALADRSSLLLSATTAKALFGTADPINKIIRMDNKDVFKVAGVYDDLPQNTTFAELAFLGAFDYYIKTSGNERSPTDWGDNSLFMYVQLADGVDITALSNKIKNIKLNNLPVEDRKFKPVIFLQPMNKWHLYSEFNIGVNTGGAIQYVWLFGAIGVFVLLLACINFMNLSTARSEKRAKEVGIRKAVGSLQHQLVTQFYWESFLIAFIAFVVSIAFMWMALSWFNNVSGKLIAMPLTNLFFWSAGLAFTLFTGVVAGSYPALYLSSFNPVKVLKGTFKAGPSAAIPRKILVVTQFVVSIVLIVGTIIVFQQVEFAKDRPIGYNRAGLVDIQVTNDDLHKNFAAFKADLVSSQAVSTVAEASSATTAVNNSRGDINWAGKDLSQADFFGNIRISAEYGKAVGWQFIYGHDFTVGNVVDSLSVVLNEAAATYMGFKDPIGQIVRVGKRDLTVIGVVKNMIMDSPYEPVKQTIFYLGKGGFDDILIRINPNAGTHAALDKIAAISKVYSRSVPFTYKFADDEYARKFTTEERVGKLASAFATLAIFISCLGLFGMASFTAEQRVKEIGVRKVLGASVFGLWRLLSKEFVILIGIAFCIAAPLAYGFMHEWLQHYTYHAHISWWIFALTAAGAMVIALVTVSYQSIRAALANPIKSLRSE